MPNRLLHTMMDNGTTHTGKVFRNTNMLYVNPKMFIKTIFFPWKSLRKANFWKENIRIFICHSMA